MGYNLFQMLPYLRHPGTELLIVHPEIDEGCDEYADDGDNSQNRS